MNAGLLQTATLEYRRYVHKIDDLNDIPEIRRCVRRHGPTFDGSIQLEMITNAQQTMLLKI